MGDFEEKRPLGRYRRTMEDMIKMNHKEVGWWCWWWLGGGGVAWIDLAHDREK
jgi:hypothetical protein